MKLHQLPLRLLTVLAVLTSFSAAHAAPFGIIDQQNPGPSDTFFSDFTIVGDGVTQGFKPTLAGMDALELRLRAPGASPTSLRVDVFAGDGDAGTLLGSSTTLTLSNPSFATFHFDFGSTVPLTPGAQYSFRLTYLAGFDAPDIQTTSGNPYAGGIARNPDGTGFSDYDLVFTEGLHAVPEPASLSIVALGLLAIGCCRRRQRS